MSEQPLNVRGSLKVLWRHRLLVGAVTAAGLAGGVAHDVVKPPQPAARALVIVPPSSEVASSGAPVQDTSTQIIIATSNPVLAVAGAAVSPPISAATLKTHVVVTAPGADILQFQVSAPRAGEAVKLANAEVTAYIAYINKTGAESTSGAIPALQREAAQLSKQIRSLQVQIKAVTARLGAERPSSYAGERDASLAASLQTEQQTVSLQLNNVNNQIVTEQVSGTLAAGATRVLQSAALVPLPTLDLVLYPATGATTGLFVGCSFALLRSRRDRRLRLRDEVAGAIGVPVLASVECDACRSAKDWEQLLERYRPSAVDSWTLRRLLRRMVPSGTERRLQLNLVAFANDGPSLAVGAKLVRSSAELGMNAALVPGDHPSLALLRAACLLRPSPGPPHEPFVLEPKNAGSEFASVLLTVSLLAVDELKPEVPASRGAVLLAVSSGFATADTLARMALAASDLGNRLEGVIMVNPEPDDSSVGAVPLRSETRQITRAERASHDLSFGQPR